MALNKKVAEAVFTAVDEALERANGRDQQRAARVNMVRDFTGATAEALANGPPLSGQAMQYFCLTIEAMLKEVDES